MWDLSVGVYVSTHVSADECVRVHTRIGAAETMGGTRDRLWVGVASSLRLLLASGAMPRPHCPGVLGKFPNPRWWVGPHSSLCHLPKCLGT